jgi:hypothetical protein
MVPDALFEPMQLRDFIDSLGQKKTRIKALLLDQVGSKRNFCLVIMVQENLPSINSPRLHVLWTVTEFYFWCW